MLSKINKRGDKYYIMISLILGLIVLSISLYFIFQEFFTSDLIDQESCRQSVLLRATLPETKFAGVNWKSFKDDFPLKCKTQVFDITKADIVDNSAGKIVASAMVQCWNLFGNGDLNAFPSDRVGRRSTCVPCARIRLTNDAKKYLEDNSDKRIDIETILRNGIFGGTTYYNYLRDIGEAFPALDPASGRKFELGGSEFDISYDERVEGILKNRNTGKIKVSKLFGLVEIPTYFSKVTLPKYFEPSNGDLLISYGIVTYSGREEIGDYFPYLFYFQIDQKSDPFIEVNESLLYSLLKDWKGLSFCEGWEGIPA